jgi:hypothetical protein
MQMPLTLNRLQLLVLILKISFFLICVLMFMA